MLRGGRYISARLFLMAVLFSACQKSMNLFNNDWEQTFTRIDSNMNHLPNAQAYVDSLILMAESAGDEELSTELQLFKNNYDPQKDRVNPDREDRLTKLLTRSRKNKWKGAEAEALHQLAIYYFSAKKDVKNSALYFHKAYHIYKDYDSRAFPQKFRCLYEVGNMYYSLENYERAIELLKEAIATPFYSHGMRSSAYNSLALAYRNIGKLDSALFYLNVGASFAGDKKVAEWSEIIKGNIGGVYFLQQKYEQAKNYFQDDLKRSTALHDNRSAASIYQKFAEMALIENQRDAALRFIDSAKHYFFLSDGKDLKMKQQILKTDAKAQIINGNSMRAIGLLDSADALGELLRTIQDSRSLIKAQQLIDEEEYNKQIETQMKFSRYLRNFLIVLLLLLVLISYLAINRQKLLVEKKHREHQNLLEELKQSNEKLHEFTQHLEEKNRLIEEFKKIEEESDSKEDKFATIAALEKSVLLTDDQWQDFTKLFEKVHGSFLQKLRDKLPTLSPAEIRLIALSKLNLNNKSMAAMMGVSADAIRMNKHRLRKKLNESGINDLEDLLGSI